jgi:uncharacterized damage-inducible protein DinB
VRKSDVLALFDYGYWATWQLLDVAKQAPAEEFTRPTELTWRNMRGTLVHTLDVERSWRERLQGSPKEIWDVELPEDQFASAAELEVRWRQDADVMRRWLSGLDDSDLAATVDLGPRDRFPMWFFLVHIVTHSIEQRRDVALLLKQGDQKVPDLEFLWYADSLAQ